MGYPILEYDPEPEAMIEPSRVVRPQDVPEGCVICFFREVVERVVAAHRARVIAENRWEDGPHPLYEIHHNGRRLAILQPGCGAPLAAALLEKTIALGCRKFIACGGCGVLQKGIPLGKLIVVSSAVRDEGVSYHYLPPGREVEAHPRALEALERVLRRRRVPVRWGRLGQRMRPIGRQRTRWPCGERRDAWLSRWGRRG